MSIAELIVRIILALVLPPLGVVGLNGVGCGTLILMCLLTMFFWVPGQILAIFLIVKEYSETSCRR